MQRGSSTEHAANRNSVLCCLLFLIIFSVYEIWAQQQQADLQHYERSLKTHGLRQYKQQQQALSQLRAQAPQAPQANIIQVKQQPPQAPKQKQQLLRKGLHHNPSLTLSAETALREGMNVWVVSHGGVGSNNFTSSLESLGAAIRTLTWQQNLCHARQPVSLKNLNLLGAVYIYGDIYAAVCSMKRRGIEKLNLKKLLQEPLRGSNAFTHKYTDGTLIEAMHAQFRAWTNPLSAELLGYKILSVRYEDAHDPACLRKIAFLLKLKDASNLKTTHQPRYNSSTCSDSVRAGLTDRQRDMASEMDSFKGTCNSGAWW